MTASAPYARARTRPGRHLERELSALRIIVSTARSSAARLSWREAMQRRTTRLASLFRMLPRALRDSKVRRCKVEGGWLLQAELDGPVGVLLVETRTAGRTLEDLAARPVARILRPDLVDSAHLERLEARGFVRLVQGP